MLKPSPIRDIPGDRPRLWMLDDYLDVIVWFQPDGSIFGFQLCYDKLGHERSITWNHSGSISYHHIESGESNPGDYKKTPMLVTGDDFDHRHARDQFLIRSFYINKRLVDFISEELNKAYAVATKLPFEYTQSSDTCGLRNEIDISFQKTAPPKQRTSIKDIFKQVLGYICAINALALLFDLAYRTFDTIRIAEELRQAKLSLGKAKHHKPFVNSLGMSFVPTFNSRLLFSVFHTRVKDYAAYIKSSGIKPARGANIISAITTLEGNRTLTYKWNKDSSWDLPGFSQSEENPVVCVSRDEAEAFCKWLTTKEQKLGLIRSSMEYRLPTTEEWSQAAGNTLYPWGDTWPMLSLTGNYLDLTAKGEYQILASKCIPFYDGYPNTSPVGIYSPNLFGLYDMGGNAWQWCRSAKTSTSKIGYGRGSSCYSSDPIELKSSSQFQYRSDARASCFGFRCVLSLKAAE